MVKVELRGIAKTKAKGRTYYYAWRGGPRLRGEPGSPEFHLSYNEAIESRRTLEPGRFKAFGKSRLRKTCGLDAQELVAVAGPHFRAFWRSSYCAIRSAGKNQAGHPPLAQSMG